MKIPKWSCRIKCKATLLASLKVFENTEDTQHNTVIVVIVVCHFVIVVGHFVTDVICTEDGDPNSYSNSVLLQPIASTALLVSWGTISIDQ